MSASFGDSHDLESPGYEALDSAPLKTCLTRAFLNRQSWGGGGGMRASTLVVVIAPMIMKFGTCIELDVFYTAVTKKFVKSLLLRNYDVITCTLANT